MSSFTAAPSPVLPGEVTLITVEAYDPDCAGTCTSGCGQYVRSDLTVWSATDGTFISQNNGVSGSPYAASAEWQAPLVEDTYTITLHLADNGSWLCGNRQSATFNLDIQVTTITGDPPVVDEVTASPGQVLPGQTSQLTCSASDPDGDPVTYAWETDLGTVTPGSPGSAELSAASPGVAEVICTATDVTGLQGQGSVSVSVTGAIAESSIADGLVTPLRLAVDSLGDVFVVDPAAGGLTVVNLFEDELIYRLSLAGATSVAVDWDDHLLVGGNGWVRVIDRDGTVLLELEGDGALGPVSDVAVDLAGRRYGVLHESSGRVVVYDETGAEAAAFGSTGDGATQFKGPRGLAVAHDGRWLIADTGHGQIKKMDDAGALLDAFGALGGGVGEFVRLEDVEVDSGGLIYASDSYQDWVQVFEPDGTPRETLGTYGDGLGEFQTTTGVAMAEGYDKLVAASLNTASLQVFKTSTSAVTPPAAADPLLTPSSLAFGEQATDSESAPQTVTLTNSGASLLGIREVAAEGEYRSAEGCGGFLEPGASCAIQVYFRPTSEGPVAGSLVVDTTGSPARAAIALSGSAFEPRPGVVLAPSSLTFAGQEVGTVSAPQQVQVSNVGTSPLSLDAIDASGPYLADQGCVGILPVGGSCLVDVRFAPTVVGAANPGTLSLVTDAPGSPHVAGLDGVSTPVVPLIAIDDPVVDELDGEPVEAVFVVSLDRPTTAAVTLDWATAADTATAGEDFTAASGSLTFEPGEQTAEIAVAVLGDDLLEPDEESFSVELSNAVNAVIDDASGFATLVDDEVCLSPDLLINPGAELRPENGELPGWSQAPAVGDWQRRGFPPAPVDGEFSFYGGAATPGELSQDVDVSAYAAAIDEGRQGFFFEAWVRTLYEVPEVAQVIVEYRDFDNSFALESYDSGTLLSDGEWTRVSDLRLAPAGTRWIRVRLLNLDAGEAYYDALVLRSVRAATVSIADATVVEGEVDFGEAAFGVSLACPFHEEVTLVYETRDGSAVAGEDYLGDSGSLTLAVGETEAGVGIDIVGDDRDEPHESFSVDLDLDQPSGAVLLDGEGTGTILNDDFCAEWSGWWLENPDEWTVDWLEIGGIEYERAELVALLAYTSTRDATHVLARELITAKLNLARGAQPGDVGPFVDRADGFLEAFPPGSQPSGDVKRQARDLSDRLEEFNESGCPEAWMLQGPPVG